jgi:hypothetical protein
MKIIAYAKQIQIATQSLSRPNAQVEFLEAFLIQLVEREGQPVVAVEA